MKGSMANLFFSALAISILALSPKLPQAALRDPAVKHREQEAEAGCMGVRSLGFEIRRSGLAFRFGVQVRLSGSVWD